MFYKNLHEKALEIFGPTIRTRWNAQNDKLKDDLMNDMFNLFGDTFNRKGATATASLDLKYVRKNYRDNLKINPKYECPLVVPKKDWKALMDYTKEKELRKTRKGSTTRFKKVYTYHIFNEKCSIFLLLNRFKLRSLGDF